MRTSPARPSLVVIALFSLLAACFVNEAEESPGNGASQDVGLHVRLDGNFVLNRDGTRIITSALLDEGDGVSTSYLVGLRVPDMTVLIGPSLDGLKGAEIMLTPDPNVAWLIGFRDHSGDELRVLPFFLDTMTAGRELALPPGHFNAAILAGDGATLALAEVWDSAASHKLTVVDVPSPPTLIDTAAGAWEIDVDGAVFDVRFTRDGGTMLVLSVPVDGEGRFVQRADLSVWSVGAGTPILEARHTFDDFSLNLLGVLTWAIRISPDGRFAAVSGSRDDVAVTEVVDLVAGVSHDTVACDGPVGFTPDSELMIGYDRRGGEASVLVVTDLVAGTVDTVEYAYANPIYWVARDGRRIVTYPFGDEGLVITDLDALESTEVRGEAVALREFVVGPDADFIYLVHDGGLYLLDIELGSVSELEPPSRDYDNINILPDGDALVLSAEDTSRFSLWSLLTATTEASVDLPRRL